MIKPLISLATVLALAAPLNAQDEPQEHPSPNQIVAEASSGDWMSIPAEDLLVMTLAPDAEGNERKVVIQLMPVPFSQGWVENIRTLARAKWYDDISVNRVQDNYVVQWGDPNYDNPEATGEAKPLPEGLRVMGEDEYTVGIEDVNAVISDGTKRAWGTSKVTMVDALEKTLNDPRASEEDKKIALMQLLTIFEFPDIEGRLEDEHIANISIESTKTSAAPQGWHERDSFAEWVEFWNGWPLANFEIAHWEHWEDEEGNVVVESQALADPMENSPYKVVDQSRFWPVHCYGMVGVGRNYSPDTGSGAELYAVIGHAPRHLDRNIALVGRVIEGMEHLSSLPRGKGDLGFYAADEVDKRAPILTVRVASDLPAGEQPRFEYLDTESETFARYADARANRRDPFFIVPAGGADICNIPVPVRRVAQ